MEEKLLPIHSAIAMKESQIDRDSRPNGGDMKASPAMRAAWKMNECFDATEAAAKAFLISSLQLRDVQNTLKNNPDNLASHDLGNLVKALETRKKKTKQKRS